MAWIKPEVRVINFRSWKRAGFKGIPNVTDFIESMEYDKHYMIRLGRPGTLQIDTHSQTVNRGWWTGLEWRTNHWEELRFAYQYKVREDA